MARNSEVYPAIASIEYLYNSVGEMPWSEIESAVQVEFSVEHRKEILGCVDAYCQGYSWVKEAVPVKEFDAFRESLSKQCEAMLELAEG